MGGRRGGVWMGLLVLWVVSASASDHSYGLDLFTDLMATDPALLCPYVTCVDPVPPDQCPEGTRYHHGLTQFGCCGACVQFLQEGEVGCTGELSGDGGVGDEEDMLAPTPDLLDLNDTSNVLLSSWCDHYLTCRTNDTCEPSVPIETGSCLYSQRQYDWAVGSDGDYVYYRDDYRWRPTCDPDGSFAPKQCKGPHGEQRCVCVDPAGNRINGSAIVSVQHQLAQAMNCKCSRRVWERLSSGENSVTLHCLENGNFEPYQCDDGWCYCVDPVTGHLQAPILPEHASTSLPCYNATTVGEWYLRRCESEYHAHASLQYHLLRKAVLGPSTLLKCDPDGSYSALQQDSDMDRCYNKYMTKILSYPAGDGCQCVLDREFYTNGGYRIQVQCETNSGQYKPIQAQGSYRYCVDADGVRLGPLVEQSYEEFLNCAAAIVCQMTGEQCDMVCLHCPPEAYQLYNINNP